MIEVRPVSRRLRGLTPWIALLATAGLLQACGPEQAIRASKNRVFAADVTGEAKVCQVPKVSPADGQTTAVPMGVVNDGGWCGLPLQRGDGPFSAGLLTSRPTHGTVFVHEVGDFTRIDYRPERGFTGPDSFAVKLLPGNAVIQVNVTVTAATGKK
ncbi:hypothetical protein [Rhodopila sp.]|jgi:hypothetical protein|uniref:hypothetical protein n=1 Tax=Rhodopila sp. TaxID=2480087 RepID=UPI002B800AFC|nr:hypothetical protein [Rhodopila sp.]HVZ09311.1 hypothetical protein [Rhodopila sp.]